MECKRVGVREREKETYAPILRERAADENSIFHSQWVLPFIVML